MKENKEKPSRRDCLGRMAAGIAGVTGSRLAPSALEKVWAATTSNGMIYRKLGRSGERVSAIGLGGYHIGVQSTEEESIRIIRAAIDNGINFMDNCWDYNDGASEIRMEIGR